VEELRLFNAQGAAMGAAKELRFIPDGGRRKI